MQRSKFTLTVFFALILSFVAAAQDSTLGRWQVSSTRLAEGVYEVTYKGFFPLKHHLYDSSTEQELSGLKAIMPAEEFVAQPLKISTPLTSISDPTFDGAKMNVYKDSITAMQTVRITGTVPSNFRVQLSYLLGAADNFVPEEQKVTVNLDGGVAAAASNRILISSIDLNNPLADCSVEGASVNDSSKAGSLAKIFFLGFAGGLLALLTPCVFPMIPLTVSFFTKRSPNRKQGIKNAFIYGFFILLIYVLLSVPFHFLDHSNPEILNNISTNVWLNVFFFVIFVVFAFSFFGFYEITLPGSLSSNVDSKASVGTLTGIFFMALTLALVSFSCTGPILGSLLAGSLTANGGAWQLTSGMAGFGLALALPFALFALFPNWLHSLPKSGGWLNTVKVVLGFIELAMAFKFLSNADLVMHWGLLKRELFFAIWILIGLLLTLYLFGKIRFPHDNPKERISFGRKFFGVLVLAFTLYLIPGLTNTKWNNLTLISGFPPPLYYSYYQQNSQCILNLNCTHDYEEGLRMAKEQNKPMLLDFTGYACVNCRRMEENVWSQPEVYNLMKEKFIVVSLYVDDKAKLPAAQQFTYKTKDGAEKEIVTVGDKWATFETENFKNNAQPWYAIVSPDEKLLNHPVGYVPSVKDYSGWLQCGLEAFANSKNQ